MHYHTLIKPGDLMRSDFAPNPVIIDCRFDLANKGWGESNYRAAHIPGAHYAHLERDLSGPVRLDTGRHPLPDWQDLAARLGQWGVRANTQVIVYDQDSGAYAARLWWMLRAAGHQRVAVLDGGWAAWLAGSGVQDAAVPPLQAPTFRLRPGGGWLTTEQVEQNLTSGRQLLVDARGVERFAGGQEKIDPVAGHIPGALNRPFTENLCRDGTFLSRELLKKQWLQLLQGRASGSVVHMCGSGVTACHNLLAMELSGLTGSRLYVGSWSEWIRGGNRPVAVGRA